MFFEILEVFEMGTKFVNLTPHAIVFQFGDGSRESFPPAMPKGQEARVDVISGQSMQVEYNGKVMPVNAPLKYGEVQGLPAPEDGTIYIVSSMVLTQPSVVGRNDVVAPATGPKDAAIRNAQNQIEAVTRWVAA